MEQNYLQIDHFGMQKVKAIKAINATTKKLPVPGPIKPS
jgi:hypothetical protein